AEEIASARWYGGKGAAISDISEEDRLELDAGVALHVLRVECDSRLPERYLYISGEAAVWAAVLEAIVDGRQGGRASFEPGGASTRWRCCRRTSRTPRTAGRGRRGRWWRATSPTSPGLVVTPRCCTARWHSSSRARHRARRWPGGGDPREPSSTGCSIWWAGT